MKESLTSGIGFGLTSGIITTIGLMNGLQAGTGSREVVFGGILTIAFADAMSDALGMHISEESDPRNDEKHIWTATLATFFSKLIMALTFLIPVSLFELETAMLVSMAWGLGVLAVLSYILAGMQEIAAWKVILEHLVIAIVVIVATHYLGGMFSSGY